MIGKIKYLFLKTYLDIFARPSMKKFNKFLYKLSLKGLGVYNGNNFYLSGETHALNYVRKKCASQSVIFDIGANTGEYSMLIRKKFPNASIFSFEPVKKTFDLLKNNVSSSKIKTYNFGFSNKERDMYIYIGSKEKDTLLASIYRKTGNIKEKITLDTIDNFCNRNKIDKIDFLKIDAEAAEYDILNGALKMITSGKIRIIQFEFNQMNLLSKRTMQDFKNLLKEFTFYRLLPRGFLKIDPEDAFDSEIYLFQNIIAIKN